MGWTYEFTNDGLKVGALEGFGQSQKLGKEEEKPEGHLGPTFKINSVFSSRSRETKTSRGEVENRRSGTRPG